MPLSTHHEHARQFEQPYTEPEKFPSTFDEQQTLLVEPYEEHDLKAETAFSRFRNQFISKTPTGESDGQ